MRRPISFPTPVAIPQLRAEPGDWIHVDPSDHETPLSVVIIPHRSEVEEFLASADTLSLFAARLAAALPLRPTDLRRLRDAPLRLL
jgi:hypothetical protein